MKTLEELGISPAPWKKAVNNYGMGEDIIWDAKGHKVEYSGLSPYLPYERHKANHSIIVAAPDLYEALAAIVSRLEAGDMLTKGDSVTDMVLDYAKKALANAAGESEVAK